MRVLVTRPAEEWPAMQARLQALGHEAVPCPVLSIVALPGATADLDGVQAVVVTSRAGVRTLADVSPERGVRMLAVGDATASLARDLGYARVESAAGDADALLGLAARVLDPGAGPVLVTGGQTVSVDVAGRMETAGLKVRRAVLYEAKPVTGLSEAAQRALTAGELDAVAFFSPRSVATFVTLVTEAGLRAACTFLEAICLSPNVAAAAGAVPWRRVRVAASPDTVSLLRLLESVHD